MPDRQHPDQPNSFPPPSAGSTGDTGGTADGFEQLLRSRLHQLAEHAPTTVHSLDELRVEHADRAAGRTHARREGRHRRTAGIGATIAALVGAAGITTVALSGAGTAGAASPEEAVRSFLDAAQSEDVFGMIDALDPAEVPAARTAAERGRADAVEADLVSEGFQLDGVEGVDLAFSDLTMTTESVTDQMSVVTVNGAGSLSFDPQAFPFGADLAEALGPDLTRVDEQFELSDATEPAMLATVERDGRWYVSTSFTIGEYLRRNADVAMPAVPLTAVGAPTPEAAADEFWANLLDLDLAGALSQSAPGEGDAMLAYGPLLVDAWNESGIASSDGFDLAYGDATYDVSGNDDRRRVEATAFTISGTVPESDVYGFYDPSLPTVITTWDGTGIVVLDPGVPIPATLDGYDIDTDYRFPEGNANYTNANQDGTVQQLPAKPDGGGPLALTVQRADGCTTFSGPGASTLLGGSVTSTQADGTVIVESNEVSTPGFELVGEQEYRNCGDSSAGGGLLSLFVSGGLTELPALEVVEVDGQWYVSPIGTIAELVLDVVRTARDGGLFDSPLAYAVVGIDRSGLTAWLSNTRLEDLTEECRLLAVAGADGLVTGIVDDPDLGQVRACIDGSLYTDTYLEPIPDAPAPVEATVPAVPASTPPLATEASTAP